MHRQQASIQSYQECAATLNKYNVDLHIGALAEIVYVKELFRAFRQNSAWCWGFCPTQEFDYHVAYLQAFDDFNCSITSKMVISCSVLTSRSPRLKSITTTPNVFRNNLDNAAIYPKRIGSSAAANHINQVDYSASNPKQNNRRARNSPKTRAISCTERTAYYGIVLCRRPYQYTAKTHIICTSTLTPTNNTEHRTKEHRSKTWRRARS